MKMLVAGADVSGRPGIGNLKYMSIVIGTKEKISAIMQQLGRRPIHMNNIAGDKAKREIIRHYSLTARIALDFALE